MKTRIFLIGALMLLFVAVSCNRNHPIPVSTNELLFERDGGTEVVRCLEGYIFTDAYANVPEYDFAEEDGYVFQKYGWVTLKYKAELNGSSELFISVTENTTGSQRSCEVEMWEPFFPRRATINVTQKK